MDDVEQWRWIWLGACLVFALGEMFTAGSFFLLPFAVGAGLAALLAFLDVDLLWQWLAFVGVSGGAFAALRPLARRLDVAAPAQGVGARRLIGELGVVLEAIDGHGDAGQVRIQREEWRAVSVEDTAIAEGTRVRVLDVRGTRLVVWPADDPPPLDPPD